MKSKGISIGVSFPSLSPLPNQKGISTIIAVVLLLLITIGIVWSTYTFLTSATGSVTKAGGKQIERTAEILSSCIKIESVGWNKVYVRNCGVKGKISNSSIAVFVDGIRVGHNMNKEEIDVDNVGEIELYGLWRFSLGEHKLKVVSGGVMDEVAVKFKPHPSAVAVWEFDEGSGNKAKDSINDMEANLMDWRCVYTTNSYGGHWYEYYNIGCTDLINTYPRWRETKNYCQNRGGYLPVISSSGENNFIHSLGGGNKWIGYYQDPDDLNDNNGWPEGCPGNEPNGCWKWLPSEASSYTNWHPGEPNNAWNREHCAHMRWDGTWNDLACWGWLHFICEYTSAKTPLNINGKYFYPKWVNGLSGKAISFDGYDDWLQVNNFSKADPDKEVSVFVVLKKNWDFGKWLVNRRSVYRDIPSNPSLHAYWRSWGIYVTKSGANDRVGACVTTVTNGVKCVAGNTKLYDGNWHFIGMSYDGSYIRVYEGYKELNKLDQSGEIYYDYKDSSATHVDWRLFIGDFDGWTSPGTAIIDKIMIFSKALTPDETIWMEM